MTQEPWVKHWSNEKLLQTEHCNRQLILGGRGVVLRYNRPIGKASWEMVITTHERPRRPERKILSAEVKDRYTNGHGTGC